MVLIVSDCVSNGFLISELTVSAVTTGCEALRYAVETDYECERVCSADVAGKGVRRAEL